MGRETLPPKTSNEELLSQYDEIMNAGARTDGGESLSCEGNIAHECVQESVNEVYDILGTGRDDWVMIGGIPTQLLFLHEMPGDDDELMRRFGRRTTNDFDIITTSPGEIRSEFRDAGYGEGEKRLDADIFGTGFMAEANRVIENGRYIDVEGYGIDAEIRVPTATDFLYTKVHDDYSRESEGTSMDAEALLESDRFAFDNQRLRSLLGGNQEAWEYLEELEY
ncbi:MAG: hypothetical protein ABEI58_02260 [Candidatus Nanohaloarchaea archaeon]